MIVPSRADVVELYRQHVNVGFARLASMMALPVEARSSGAYVFDSEGQQYLDCGGYGVFIMGHCHPTVVSAVREQLERHPLATRSLLNAELALAAQKLVSIAPPGLKYVFFTNSGAESAELGLKLARLNGKRKIIAMQGGYHGKTLGALSVTGRHQYREPFHPLLPDVTFIPYGDAEALGQTLSQNIGEACVILEPVQGEGGAIFPPPGYLKQVYDLCRQNDTFFILDEIQSGLGRLGQWWGATREGITPDVMLVGKGLSGGVVPVGAVVATPEAFAPLNQDPLMHSSTFAGNPLAMVAAYHAIEVIDQENLLVRAQRLGEQIKAKLCEIFAATCPTLVQEVRGEGLLIGVEFTAEHLAGDFMMRLLTRKIIVSHSLNANRVVRLTPPAVLRDSDCSWLYTAVQEAASELKQAWYEK